ncbi:MAG: glycosyltransferase [Chloroflexota bacterium]
MWGYIAARTLNIPNICFVTTFVMEGSMGTLGVGGVVDFIRSALPHARTLMRWRRSMAEEFGSDVAGGITEFADLNIVFTSREFQPASKQIDDRFRFVGPSIDPATRDGDFPYELLTDGMKVYLSLGTVNNLDTDFYRTAFTAFADYPAQFILSAGNNTSLAKLGDIPANFVVRNYVPQLEILQRVDAFVTHGGMNSVHEGLYYGVPEVVVPHHTEQLLNGKRVAQTEVGILLGERRPYGHVTAPELRAAVDSVLTDPLYHANAARMGQTLRDAGGYTQAVSEIEKYLENINAPALMPG